MMPASSGAFPGKLTVPVSASRQIYKWTMSEISCYREEWKFHSIIFGSWKWALLQE